MKHLIIIFLLCLANLLYSQRQIADVFLQNTVLLKYKSGGNASGVIIIDTMELILVTAKHCLINENNIVIDTSMTLIYYPGTSLTSKPDSLSINLSSLNKSGKVIVHHSHDIAIIKLASIISKNKDKVYLMYYDGVVKHNVNPPSPITFANIFDINQTKLGDECMVIGFPSSLRNQSSNEKFDFNRPLLRKGIIAGIDPDKGTIVIDAPVYQGNSGGPVIQVPSVAGERVGLIGIVSGTVIHEIKNYDQYFRTITSINLTNSGYSIIIPIDYAKELIKFSRKK
ncbi:MAG: trypsin-like peptidase domain-containing protein [Saprospiraceae bacterium]|nr:trypsin-like peptidase domain-containing protein [Saprospiraceae bacterium]